MTELEQLQGNIKADEAHSDYMADSEQLSGRCKADGKADANFKTYLRLQSRFRTVSEQVQACVEADANF